MNNLQIIHHRELPRRRPTPRTHCNLQREEMESSVTGGEDSGGNISLSVKFSGRTIPITNLSPDSTIKDLKSLLQPLTNVLPRGQKLICKGVSFFSSVKFD